MHLAGLGALRSWYEIEKAGGITLEREVILMGNTIHVQGATLQSVASLLAQGVDEYCALRLMALGGVAPVAGSSEHDGTISSLLSAALTSYATIVSKDGVLVLGIGDTFSKVDAGMASAIEGA